nr:U-box domain-containing protein 18-like [Ipomoea batatas]
MINKSNEYTRRILSFPAIRPSETVSFPSLIAALIHLGHAIRDYKSKTFFTNRKNAKFLMRLVDDLLIFLEEIRNGDSRFAGSMVLSLSELHFLFQKVLFLLEDCTREDARIWMAAKSEHVATQFRVVGRAMAVALEVLPLDGGDEVREVVEFVRKQAMGFRFEVEFEDRIRSLTKTSTFNRSCLGEAGVVPPLLLQLGSWDSSVQENSMAALLNLSKNSRSRDTIAENGGLVLILDVLKEGVKMEARQHAAGALYYLASVEEYRGMIGENPEAIPSLVELVRAGCDHGKKNALVTIFSLLKCPESHWKVVSAGLVPLLIDLLPSLKREDLITDCLAVLSSLSEKLEGAIVVLYAGALPIVIDLLNSCSSRTAKECCVSLLLALCINGGSDAVRVLVKNPSLMPPLYLLLTQGTSRASKKASSLIRLLQEFNNKSSSGLINPPLPQDQFVNVW